MIFIKVEVPQQLSLCRDEASTAISIVCNVGNIRKIPNPVHHRTTSHTNEYFVTTSELNPHTFVLGGNQSTQWKLTENMQTPHPGTEPRTFWLWGDGASRCTIMLIKNESLLNLNKNFYYYFLINVRNLIVWVHFNWAKALYLCFRYNTAHGSGSSNHLNLILLWLL